MSGSILVFMTMSTLPRFATIDERAPGTQSVGSAVDAESIAGVAGGVVVGFWNMVALEPDVGRVTIFDGYVAVD